MPLQGCRSSAAGLCASGALRRGSGEWKEGREGGKGREGSSSCRRAGAGTAGGREGGRTVGESQTGGSWGLCTGGSLRRFPKRPLRSGENQLRSAVCRVCFMLRGTYRGGSVGFCSLACLFARLPAKSSGWRTWRSRVQGYNNPARTAKAEKEPMLAQSPSLEIRAKSGF